MTVGQMAEHLGFSDVSSFRRAFKRWTGVTPATYRKQQRSGASLLASDQTDVDGM